jgi:short-subunit dehydrogenase
MNQRYYENRKCLITGASSGLGAALSLALAAHGASLVLIGRDKIRLKSVAQQCIAQGAKKVEFKLSDFADIEASRKLFEELVITPNEHFDLVIHAAASNMISNIVDAPIDRVATCFSVNVITAFVLAQAIIPVMSQVSKGHFVLISSGTAYFGVPGESAYSASKAALERFGESLFQEVQPSGVGVTIILPGPMETQSLRNPTRFGTAKMIARPNKAADPNEIARRIIKRLPRQPRRLELSWRTPVIKYMSCLIPDLLIKLLAK